MFHIVVFLFCYLVAVPLLVLGMLACIVDLFKGR